MGVSQPPFKMVVRTILKTQNDFLAGCEGCGSGDDWFGSRFI